jgi:hypothetical protein
MVQESFTPPETVVNFEKLMFISIGISTFIIIMKMPDSIQRGESVLRIILENAFVITLMLWLVVLASRKRKNFARWSLLVWTALGMLYLGLSMIFPQIRHSSDDGFIVGIAAFVTNILAIVALYLVFSAPSRPWFHPGDMPPLGDPKT